MKVTNENVSLLGNQKFCNKKEAINIAQKVNSSQLGLNLWNKMWECVLTRKDIQGKDALKYAKDLGVFSLCLEILKRDDISWEEAIAILLGTDSATEHPSIMYYILLRKNDMPIFQALSYAKELQPIYTLHDYIACVLRRNDIKNLETKMLLNFAKRLDCRDLWFSISLMPRVQEFMADVIVEKAYFYLNKSICDEMKKVILSRLDIHQNVALKSLRMADIPTCISILVRPDISPRKAVYLAKKDKSPLVLEAVLKRKDVREYLGLPNQNKEELIIKNDNFRPSSQVPYGCNW
ncbi:MAG: hypothetical protein ACOYMB_02240 [Patescibacteria group bacterium]